MKTLTQQCIDEMERCIIRMRMYQSDCKDNPDLSQRQSHAAALRSTMDVTDILVEWRSALTWGQEK